MFEQVDKDKPLADGANVINSNFNKISVGTVTITSSGNAPYALHNLGEVSTTAIATVTLRVDNSVGQYPEPTVMAHVARLASGAAYIVMSTIDGSNVPEGDYTIDYIIIG